MMELAPGTTLGHDSDLPIDWRALIGSVNWQSMFTRAGFHVDDETIEGGASPPRIDDFSCVPLNLSLTDKDWRALRRKCRYAAPLPKEGTVIILDGNFLYFILDRYPTCYAILRLATVKNGLRVVEAFVEIRERDPDEKEFFASIAVAEVVGCFARLLPGTRCGYISRRAMWPLGWFWREPGAPGYATAKRKIWTTIALQDIDCDPAQAEWLEFQSPERKEGPIDWSKADMEILRRDPNLCCWTEMTFAFVFAESSPLDKSSSLLILADSFEWLYSVPVEARGDSIVSSGLFVNRAHEAGIGNPKEIRAIVRKAIADLLVKKRALYSKNRRLHRQVIPTYNR